MFKAATPAKEMEVSEQKGLLERRSTGYYRRTIAGIVSSI